MESPNELSERLERLASEYGTVCGRLGDLTRDKAERWLQLRETVSSDTRATKLWDATADGKEEGVLRWKERGLLRQMSSIRTRLRVLSDEVKNMY